MIKSGSLKCLLLLTGSLLSTTAYAQAVPGLDELMVQNNPDQTILRDGSGIQAQTSTPSLAALTIPAGTRVMMVLKSPLHTTSGTPGSGLYLETLYPVIQDNRVVIPAHTQVQGVVESDKRPGHLDRVSEFRFRFTALVFPNNYVAPIDGILQDIPGARDIRTKDNKGTISPVDQTEKVVVPTAIGAVGGAIIGSAHHSGIGKFVGGGLGAALGLGSVLLKRGDEINLVRGTNIEMVLQAPLSLGADQAATNARYVPEREVFQENPPPTGPEKRRARNRERREAISFPRLGTMWFLSGLR